MALSLSTQLESLERERLRLEELLMLDANWRALRELDERDVEGEGPLCAESAKRKSELEQALKANRIYVARAKLIETIELLSGPNRLAAGPEGGNLASRIIMLSEPTGDTFRAKLRLKPAEPKELEPENSRAPDAELAKLPLSAAVKAEAPANADRQAMPDALMLIAGLGGRAVALLHEAGITRFAHIAEWSSAEATAWRKLLNGVAEGSTGWWIEQAAMLARGQATAFSMRLRRGEFAAVVPVPESEPLPTMLVATESTEPTVTNAGGLNGENAVEPLRDLHVEPAGQEQRLKTAQEIAQALAAHEGAHATPVSPRDDVEAVPSQAPDAQPSNIGLTKRGPYTRPHARRAGEEPSSESGGTVVSRGTAEKRSLMGRLKDVVEPHRFEAATYAAYRGTVEEASVTIVRSGPCDEGRKPSQGAGQEQADAPPQNSSRFLKALTGRE